MQISGIIVDAVPAKIEAVNNELLKIDGIEIHAKEDNGKFVITLELEDNSTDDEVAVMKQIHDIQGVASASMVYHHFEEETDERVGKMDEKLAVNTLIDETDIKRAMEKKAAEPEPDLPTLDNDSTCYDGGCE